MQNVPVMLINEIRERRIQPSAVRALHEKNGAIFQNSSSRPEQTFYSTLTEKQPVVGEFELPLANPEEVQQIAIMESI